MPTVETASPYLKLDEVPHMPIIYLDNGATSFPKPDEVYKFMDSFYRNYGVNPGRSGFDLCLEAGSLVDETRKLLCKFLGGSDSNRLVFGYNSTDALNLAIFGLIKAGDHVVTTHVEHNATLRPLWKLENSGVEVDWVDFDAQGWVDPQEIIGLLRPNTKAVVMNHGSNVIGTVQDVAAVGKVCRERGILLIVDISQSAGMVPQAPPRVPGVDIAFKHGGEVVRGRRPGRHQIQRRAGELQRKRTEHPRLRARENGAVRVVFLGQERSDGHGDQRAKHGCLARH